MSVLQKHLSSGGVVENVADKRPTVMLLTHEATRCGVAQYGLEIYRALAQSQRFRLVLATCSSMEQFLEQVAQHQPQIIIYNYHMDTLPWLTVQSVQQMREKAIIQVLHHHVISHESSTLVHQQLFDYHVFQDPTFPLIHPFMFSCGRLIPQSAATYEPPEIFTVGSYGFAHPVKGLHELIRHVQQTFDQARIFLHLPFNEITDPDGSSMTFPYLAECRALLQKPGISLIVNHEFWERERVIDFLARNTINAFFYEAETTNAERSWGISSCLDWALAARRPIAITRSPLFKHVSYAIPSICVEDRDIQSIAADGLTPLLPFYEKWSEPQFLARYEGILARIFAQTAALSTEP